MIDISLIVPYWEGREQLNDFFASVSDLVIPTGRTLEVVICDDGSSLPPDPVSWRDVSFPVKVVTQDHRGQSAATNHAVKQARGKWIWLLAQDIRVEKDTLVELLKTAEIHPGTLIQGWIDHDPQLLEDRFTRFIAVDSDYQFSYDLIPDDNDLLPFFHYAPHALVEREKFLATGGYDESLPYGFQDTDFGLRWILDGGHLVLSRNSRVIHSHKFDVWGFSKRYKMIGRAIVKFIQKWQPVEELDRMKPIIRLYLLDLAKAVSLARKIINRWVSTGDEPEDEFQFTDDFRRKVRMKALEAAFHLTLSNAFYRGMYDEMGEQGHGFRLVDADQADEHIGTTQEKLLIWVPEMINKARNSLKNKSARVSN